MDKSRHLHPKLGARGPPAPLRHHLYDRHAAHTVDHDGRAIPHRNTRRGPQHRLQHRQPADVRVRPELLQPAGHVRRQLRRPVLLRRRGHRGHDVHAGVPARDARQKAVGYHRLLQPQHLLYRAEEKEAAEEEEHDGDQGGQEGHCQVEERQ